MKYNHGNYVMYEGEIIQLEVLDLLNIQAANLEGVDPYQPLPITPELLRKLGYEGRIENQYFRDATENAGKLPCFKLGKLTIAQWGKPTDWQVWIDTKDIKRIQYIHQLQNMYESIHEKPLIFIK